MEFLCTMHQASTSLAAQAIASSTYMQRSLKAGEADPIRKLREQAIAHLMVPTARHVHAVVEVDLQCIHCGHHKEPKQVRLFS